MSILRASIKKIQNVENLNLVTFDFNGIDLKMMSLGLGEEVQVGKQVTLAIKPSSIAIAKEFSGKVSYANKIHASILEVNNGELLSSIKLQANGNIFESLITCEVSKQMKLEVGDKVIALLKASELSISEIIS
ncbi:MAG: molybdopterin-binding protein [Sulfurimonas sp.]|jgi:molybdopterin-binding protein|uniref:TOBE domain-containing protein n=1 Tax=Sulfurimonas sp. TaxID=2022749 RepID=UPI0039E6BC23